VIASERSAATKRPLDVGMVCFASVGGSGTVAVELAHALEARGHRVTVIAEGRPHRLRVEAAFVPVEPARHPLFEHPPYSLALASAIVATTRARPLDVVHLHYAVPHAASATLVRHALGASSPALIVTVHGTDVTTFGTEDAYGSVIGACLRSLDAVTAPSRFLEARAAALLGVSPTVVPNFVDPAVFRPEAARPERIDALFGGAPRPALTLAHVSSFRPVKAATALVPLMRALVRDVPGGARMVLIGDGPERARVEADARAAGVADALRFVAPIDAPEELAAWVAACDLFVLPSETESFGLAALEALACGVPVVARRVGGIPEVVRDAETGTLVGEVGELGAAIASLAASPDLRRAMGAEASADARRRFCPDVVVGGFEAVYERAIGARRAGVASATGVDDA
jgi:N-acetyl-alpha-D-glucosaminyl L-malate synthase BshA